MSEGPSRWHARNVSGTARSRESHTGATLLKRVGPRGCRAAGPPVPDHPGGRAAQRGGNGRRSRRRPHNSHNSSSNSSTSRCSSCSGRPRLRSLGGRTWLRGRVQDSAAAAEPAAGRQRGACRRRGVGCGAGAADEAGVRRGHVTAQQVQVSGPRRSTASTLGWLGATRAEWGCRRVHSRCGGRGKRKGKVKQTTADHSSLASGQQGSRDRWCVRGTLLPRT